MKQLAAIIFTVIFAQVSWAHGFRFEGPAGSTAALMNKGLVEQSKTDTSIVLVKGYYGLSVFREDPVSAIRCTEMMSRYSCIIAMKHDRPLDPMELYPLGNDIDPYGTANSNSETFFNILKAASASDENIGVLETPSASQVDREADDASVSCKAITETAKFECRFQH